MVFDSIKKIISESKKNNFFFFFDSTQKKFFSSQRFFLFIFFRLNKIFYWFKKKRICFFSRLNKNNFLNQKKRIFFFFFSVRIKIFINPKKLAGYNYHKPARYWSYLHQVSYRKPGPRIASWAQPEASIIWANILYQEPSGKKPLEK